MKKDKIKKMVREAFMLGRHGGKVAECRILFAEYWGGRK